MIGQEESRWKSNSVYVIHTKLHFAWTAPNQRQSIIGPFEPARLFLMGKHWLRDSSLDSWRWSQKCPFIVHNTIHHENVQPIPMSSHQESIKRKELCSFTHLFIHPFFQLINIYQNTYIGQAPEIECYIRITWSQAPQILEPNAVNLKYFSS